MQKSSKIRVNQKLPFGCLFCILDRNVSDSLRLHKTSSHVVQVHCHVLISQYPWEFLLPSSPLHRWKRASHLSEYGKDQAELNLLPNFPGSPRPWHRKIISLLVLCAKIAQNALGSPWSYSLCLPYVASQRAVPSSRSGSREDRIPYPCCDSAGLSQTGISEITKEKFKGNQRKSRKQRSIAGSVPGLRGPVPFLMGAQTMNSGDDDHLLVSQLLSHYQVKGAILPPCQASVLDGSPPGIKAITGLRRNLQLRGRG